MKQCYISESLNGLDFKAKYNLSDYMDSSKPLIIFGMYRPEDLEVYARHKSDLILVWQGMDAKSLSKEWISVIKRRKATHYSISHWIRNSLNSYGIENISMPISATIPNLSPCPKGDCIYFYSSQLSEESANYYGEYMIDEIKARTGLQVIKTFHGLHTKEKIIELYKKCFINLRLTKYDGCPNTNLEMGLMGRRSVFNGNIPGSIKWNDLDDICENIVDEFVNRHKPETISGQINDFLNIEFP